MTDTDAAERACARLATACYTLMDLGKYDETAALFTDDATWVRGGKPTVGRAAIRAALDKRPADQVSRHVVTNVVVNVLDADEAVGTAYFMPLRGALGGDGTAPMPAIQSLGDLAFQFRREAGGWRIAFLKPGTIFKT